MSKIITLTMSPAIDKSSSVAVVAGERKLRCAKPTHEPGGGGINVSRALIKLGGDALAIYPAGGPTGEMLKGFMAAENIRQQVIPIVDWTRENLIVFEESTGRQFRFGMPGAEMSAGEWERCLQWVEAAGSADYIVASGSLPPGVPPDFYARLSPVAKRMNARLVVDTSGEPLRHCARAGVYLLKPNYREFIEMFGGQRMGEREQEGKARELLEQGGCEVLLLSLGAGGALLVTREGCERVRAPSVPVVCKVGAGDSTVAGMTLALSRGLSVREAARFAVACGTAAVMTPRTELCRREDAERLYAEMERSPQ